MYQLNTTDDLGGRLSFPLARKRTIIGRDSTCDIQLIDEEISRQHAKVYIIEDAIYIKDNNSTNGVFVNNLRIEKITQLKPGDEVIIGSYQFHLRQEELTEEAVSQTTVLNLNQLRDIAREEAKIKIDPENDELVEQPTALYDKRELAAAMYRKKIGLASLGTLEVLAGPSKGRKFMVGQGSHVIGRGGDATLRLDDPRISSRHAQIEADAKRFAIEDLNSLNGTLINNVRISSRVLAHNDTIMMGNTKLRFQLPLQLRPKHAPEPSAPEPAPQIEAAPIRHGLPNWLSILLILLLIAGLIGVAVEIIRLIG